MLMILICLSTGAMLQSAVAASSRRQTPSSSVAATCGANAASRCTPGNSPLAEPRRRLPSTAMAFRFDPGAGALRAWRKSPMARSRASPSAEATRPAHHRFAIIAGVGVALLGAELVVSLADINGILALPGSSSPTNDGPFQRWLSPPPGASSQLLAGRSNEMWGFDGINNDRARAAAKVHAAVMYFDLPDSFSDDEVKERGESIGEAYERWLTLFWIRPK